MRAKSLKRAKADREWPAIRAAVMERDGHTCQAGLGEVGACEGPLDPHHVVPKARDTKLRLEPTNLKVLCRYHHSWVHDHPAEATALGLLKSAPVVPSPQEPKG